MDFSTVLMPVITLLTAQITVLELGRLRPVKKLYLILLIELIFQTAICAAILVHYGLAVYARCFFFIMDAPAFLTFYWLSARRDLRDLFTVLITIFISFAISLPSIWVAHIFGGGYFWYNLIRVVIFSVLILLIHYHIRERYLQIQDELKQGWSIFCILPIIGLMILAYQYMIYCNNGNFFHMAINCFFVLLLMTAVFFVLNYVLNQLHDRYLVQEQQRILTLQNKAQLEQFERQREAAEISNRRWHDLRHNTQQLIELIESGNVDNALDYLKEQIGMEQIPKTVYCLHPAVNSILCFWAERSGKAGIVIEILTDVPDKLSIEPMELSALFSNAIENAYEACTKLSDDIKKFIKVEARYNGKRLAISVVNSCSNEIVFKDDMPVSSKEGGGIGTRSIAYTVQRFSGTKFYEAKNGIFTARFILNV
jgi:hypothetical protein